MSNLHSIAYVRDESEASCTLTFTCLGDESSKCHNYPSCGCDFWSDDHEHPKEPHEDCWLVSWFENNGQGASYTGEDEIETCSCGGDYCPSETRTGFITTSLQDEQLEWEWK